MQRMDPKNLLQMKFESNISFWSQKKGIEIELA